MLVQFRVAYNATHYVGNELQYVTFSEPQQYKEWYTKHSKNVTRVWVDTYYYVAKTIFKYTNLSTEDVRRANEVLSNCSTEQKAYDYLVKLELQHENGGSHVHVPE